MSRIRTTLEIRYKDEVRDLRVTFDVIDRVRGFVPWEQLAVEFEKDDPVPNFSMMAKFVFHNLKAAGFKIDEDDLQDIYDEILISEERESYIQLIGQLLSAYMPQGKKKAEVVAKKATQKVSQKKA
tara:strand:- start:4250 stop:4627 length:378 start_codon:yes stop_codon:yes gene_type:complete